VDGRVKPGHDEVERAKSRTSEAKPSETRGSMQKDMDGRVKPGHDGERNE
jgi:hypothetical protein